MAAKTPVKSKSTEVGYPLTGKFGEMMAIARALSVSRMVPASYAGNPEAIFAAIQYGREFGIPPMSALQNIAVINGKPTLGTDLALGLCHRHKDWRGYEIVESTDEKCRVHVYRAMPNGKTATFAGEFTIDQARAAGLVRSDGPWNKWRKRMLKHRATTFAIRDAFPDSLYGQYTLEEMASESFAEQEERFIQAEDEIHAAVLEEKSTPVELPAPKIAPKRTTANRSGKA